MKNCPICAAQLVRKRYEHGQMWQCETCCGILIDQDRLQQTITRQDSSEEELQREIESEFTRDSTETIRCPKCRRKMEKVTALGEKPSMKRGQVQDFAMDVCPSCKCIWLDGGELAKIQLDYQQSTKGKEAASTYMNYSKLSDEQKKEFIKIMAGAEPDRAELMGRAVQEAVQDVLECYGD